MKSLSKLYLGVWRCRVPVRSAPGENSEAQSGGLCFSTKVTASVSIFRRVDPRDSQ